MAERGQCGKVALGGACGQCAIGGKQQHKAHTIFFIFASAHHAAFSACIVEPFWSRKGDGSKKFACRLMPFVQTYHSLFELLNALCFFFYFLVLYLLLCFL